MEAHRALARRGTEFQAGSQRLYLELRCRPLMPMALDVVARLGLATDDAKATNFAGLCCLVTESAIAGAPRSLRKGRVLSRCRKSWGLYSGADYRRAISLPHERSRNGVHSL